MRRSFRVGAFVVALALVVASCGGSDDDDESGKGGTTTTAEQTATTEATATTLSPEDQVLADYRAAKDALIAASDPPNPDHPDLLAHYSGDTLARFQDRLRNDQAQGISYVTTIETHPSPPTITGNTAVLEDCVVDRSQIVGTVSREPRSEQGETVRHSSVQLELIDGVWKIVIQENLSEPCTPS